jgi:hypothetical protein
MRQLYLAIALAAIAIAFVPAPAYSQSHCAQLQQQINAAQYHNQRAALLTRFNRECAGYRPQRVRPQAVTQEQYYGHVDPAIIRELIIGAGRIEQRLQQRQHFRQQQQQRRGH